jgi:hypothetical protein
LKLLSIATIGLLLSTGGACHRAAKHVASVEPTASMLVTVPDQSRLDFIRSLDRFAKEQNYLIIISNPDPSAKETLVEMKGRHNAIIGSDAGNESRFSFFIYALQGQSISKPQARSTLELLRSGLKVEGVTVVGPQ